MIAFKDFFRLCNEHPWAYIALLINFGVVFVNGYTDGPSAIATSVTTRAIKPRLAFLMCAFFNLLGALTIGIFSSAISQLLVVMFHVQLLTLSLGEMQAQMKCYARLPVDF